MTDLVMDFAGSPVVPDAMVGGLIIAVVHNFDEVPESFVGHVLCLCLLNARPESSLVVSCIVSLGVSVQEGAYPTHPAVHQLDVQHCCAAGLTETRLLHPCSCF